MFLYMTQLKPFLECQMRPRVQKLQEEIWGKGRFHYDHYSL